MSSLLPVLRQAHNDNPWDDATLHALRVDGTQIAVFRLRDDSLRALDAVIGAVDALATGRGTGRVAVGGDPRSRVGVERRGDRLVGYCENR